MTDLKTEKQTMLKWVFKKNHKGDFKGTLYIQYFILFYLFILFSWAVVHQMHNFESWIITSMNHHNINSVHGFSKQMFYGCSLWCWSVSYGNRHECFKHTDKYRQINQHLCLQKYAFYLIICSIDTMLWSFILIASIFFIIVSVECL